MDIDTYLSKTRERYDLTEYGFLPVTNEVALPLDLKKWDDLAKLAFRYNQDRHGLMEVIRTLPPIDTTDLELPIQKKLYVILGVLANTYVWSDPVPPKFLPKQIAVPLNAVSNMLGIQPILTHTAIDLLNWKTVYPKKYLDIFDWTNRKDVMDLDNLNCLYLMTDTRTEEWFYLIMVAIEAVGGRIVTDILKLDYMIYRDPNPPIRGRTATRVQLLNQIASNLEKMCGILDRIYERCDPQVFWKILRPYLSGWVNDRFQGLIYEGVSDEPFMLTGGSAAQSSLFAVIDAAFGVEHADEYFEKIQSYMFRSHQEFIQFVKNEVKIHQYVSNSSNENVRAAYDRIITAITAFRKKHYGIVYKYVIANANRDRKTELETGTGTDAQSDPDPDQADDGVNRGKGTGGTELKSFLIDTIKETREAGQRPAHDCTCANENSEQVTVKSSSPIRVVGHSNQIEKDDPKKSQSV